MGKSYHLGSGELHPSRMRSPISRPLRTQRKPHEDIPPDVDSSMANQAADTNPIQSLRSNPLNSTRPNVKMCIRLRGEPLG